MKKKRGRELGGGVKEKDADKGSRKMRGGEEEKRRKRGGGEEKEGREMRRVGGEERRDGVLQLVFFHGDSLSHLRRVQGKFKELRGLEGLRRVRE